LKKAHTEGKTSRGAFSFFLNEKTTEGQDEWANVEQSFREQGAAISLI